jgi:hypothetical protein
VTPLCATRPADWWTVGDDGNRLAMLLCRNACPVRARCPGLEHGRAYGMVAAGVAWSDFGRALPLCGCGRPLVARSRRGPQTMLCGTCDPPYPRRWSRTAYWRGWKRRSRAAA